MEAGVQALGYGWVTNVGQKGKLGSHVLPSRTQHWAHLVVPTVLEVTSAVSEAQSSEVTGLQAQHQEGLEVSPQLPMVGHESPNPLPTGDRRVLSGIGAQADVCLQHLQLFHLHQVPQQIW